MHRLPEMHFRLSARCDLRATQHLLREVREILHDHRGGLPPRETGRCGGSLRLVRPVHRRMYLRSDRMDSGARPASKRLRRIAVLESHSDPAFRAPDLREQSRCRNVGGTACSNRARPGSPFWRSAVLLTTDSTDCRRIRGSCPNALDSRVARAPAGGGPRLSRPCSGRESPYRELFE
jgi:hypothetical protein